MTYTQQGDRVTLEMTRDQFDQLTLILGFAVGACLRERDRGPFWRWLEFVNQLNATNPNFTPYEIPAEYRGSGEGTAGV